MSDDLAEFAHDLWVHWSTHIADQEDISEERLERWNELWVPYDELPEEQQQTDIRLVNRFYHNSESLEEYDE